MDMLNADDETKDEVNLLIFDYMISMAIHTAMSIAQDEYGEWYMTWPEDTIRMLWSMLEPTLALPLSIHIKVQILAIVRMIANVSPTEPPIVADMAENFVSTCRSTGEDAIESYAIEVAAQLHNNEDWSTKVYDLLVDIMQLLEAPILLQLERGQLEGLTRAETQQLKERAGL
ncbi:hypothetical protein BDV18DRAFT_140482, partial [Aspergillus unguis]